MSTSFWCGNSILRAECSVEVRQPEEISVLIKGTPDSSLALFLAERTQGGGRQSSEEGPRWYLPMQAPWSLTHCLQNCEACSEETPGSLTSYSASLDLCPVTLQDVISQLMFSRIFGGKNHSVFFGGVLILNDPIHTASARSFDVKLNKLILGK